MNNRISFKRKHFGFGLFIQQSFSTPPRNNIYALQKNSLCWSDDDHIHCKQRLASVPANPLPSCIFQIQSPRLNSSFLILFPLILLPSIYSISSLPDLFLSIILPHSIVESSTLYSLLFFWFAHPFPIHIVSPPFIPWSSHPHPRGLLPLLLSFQ